jgi:hypothetical protein
VTTRLVLGLLALAWAAAGAASGALGCGPAPRAGCAAGATTVEIASAAVRIYAYSVAAKAVEALGVSWLELEGSNGVEIEGSQSGCWHAGKISGPYFPGVAVYECTSQHCPNGSCPSPCLAYHTTAGMQMDTGGPPLTIEDTCIEHYGDGISMYDGSGSIVVRRVHLHETLDDGIENDFCDASASFEDSLAEDVAILFATRLRGSASGDCTDDTWAIRDSLVKIERPAYWYREGDRPGQRSGSVFKLNGDTNQPRHVLTDSVFVFDKGSGDSGDWFPPLDTIVECRNNVVLFAGTAAETAAILAQLGRGDGLPNGQRLAALVAMGCFRRVDRLESESEDEFLARPLPELGGSSWDQKVARWKESHRSARCE